MNGTSAPMTHELPKTMQQSLWRNANFVLLWSGTSISNLTFQFYLIVLPLIIIDQTKSALAMGIMRAVEFLPNLLLAAVLGVIVDRLYRKQVMRWAVSLQIIVLAVLFVLMLLHVARPWELYIIAFLVGSSGYAFGNAYHSALPLLVQKEQLTAANASLTFVGSLINIAGPAVAGFVLAVTNYTWGIAGTIGGLLLLYLMVALTDLPQTEKQSSMRNGFWADFREGWSQLLATEALWIMTVMILLLNIASAITGAVMLFYARTSLHAATADVGVIFAAGAIGAMAASLAAKRSRRVASRGALMLFSVGVSFAGQLVMFLAPTWQIIAAGMLLTGFSSGFINIHYFTLRQESTPNHLLGRVAGASSMIMKLAAPVAFVLSGFVGSLIPVRDMFLISACVEVLVFAYGASRRLWKTA